MTPADLQHWRKQAVLSQSGLATLLGVDVGTISRWERGERAIPPFLKLALDSVEQRCVKRETITTTSQRKRTM